MYPFVRCRNISTEQRLRFTLIIYRIKSYQLKRKSSVINKKHYQRKMLLHVGGKNRAQGGLVGSLSLRKEAGKSYQGFLQSYELTKWNDKRC